MMGRMEVLARVLAARRVAVIVDALAAAELPPGLRARREEDGVVISGRGLVRRLAFDARLMALRLIGRDA